MFDETSAHIMNSICVPVWRHSAQSCPGSSWMGGINQYVVSKLRKGKHTVGEYFSFNGKKGNHTDNIMEIKCKIYKQNYYIQ